jgi:hypothetical protein
MVDTRVSANGERADSLIALFRGSIVAKKVRSNGGAE